MFKTSEKKEVHLDGRLVNGLVRYADGQPTEALVGARNSGTMLSVPLQGIEEMIQMLKDIQEMTHAH